MPEYKRVFHQLTGRTRGGNKVTNSLKKRNVLIGGVLFVITLIFSVMSIKKHLPFEHYILSTQLSVAEVTQRLDSNVAPRKRLGYNSLKESQGRPYEGDVNGQTFRISKIMSFRNPFIPDINGEIVSVAGKTQVNIRLKPATGVTIFMAFWLGMMGIALAGVIITVAIKASSMGIIRLLPIIIVPIAIFFIITFIFSYRFNSEFSNAKIFLTSLLEAQQTTQKP